MHVRSIPYNEIRNFEIICKMDYFRVRQLETFGSFAVIKIRKFQGMICVMRISAKLTREIFIFVVFRLKLKI